MDGNIDLRDVLLGWPYDEEDNVRLLTTKDGREIMQIRLPVGMEQYELQGRPDGLRPYGHDSVLTYWEEQAKSSPIQLDHEQCVELFEEGLLYYYRYLHLFQMQDWERTIADTARNIRLFDLVLKYAETEEDRTYLEQWRPYIVRFHAVAEAMLALREEEFEQASAIVQQAVAAIDALPPLDNPTFQFERERSLDGLRQMLSQIGEHVPVTELEELEQKLDKAVEAEHYEQAAELRDRIREMKP